MPSGYPLKTTVHLRLTGSAAALCGYIGPTFVEVGAGHAADIPVSCANCTAQLAAGHDSRGVPTTPPRDEVVAVARAMRRFGGGFVSALGEALERADNMNAAIIKRAWPAYWKKYSGGEACTRSQGQADVDACDVHKGVFMNAGELVCSGYYKP